MPNGDKRSTSLKAQPQTLKEGVKEVRLRVQRRPIRNMLANPVSAMASKTYGHNPAIRLKNDKPQTLARVSRRLRGYFFAPAVLGRSISLAPFER